MRDHTEHNISFENGAATISWQCGDDHRAARLFRVAHFLYLNDALSDNLIRLHDHAGILRPCWRNMPRDGRALQLIHEAWKLEGEQLVWHMLGDDPRGAPFLEYEAGAATRLNPHYLSDGKQAEVFLHNEGGEFSGHHVPKIRPPEPPREASSSNWLAGPPPPPEKATS